MANNNYQEDSFGVLDFAKETAAFALNPVNRYLYNPGNWSVTRGAINYNFNTFGVKSAKNIMRFANNLMGKPAWAKTAADSVRKWGGTASSAVGFGGSKSAGWIGVSSFNSPTFFAHPNPQAMPTKLTNAISNFIDGGALDSNRMNTPQFRTFMKGEYKAAGQKALGYANYGEAFDSQFGLYNKMTTFENMDFNVQKRLIKGKIKSTKTDIKYFNRRANRLSAVGNNIIATDVAKRSTITGKFYGALDNVGVLKSEKALLGQQLMAIRAKQVGLGVAKLGFKGAVLVGKVGSAYMTASMVAQAVSMIATPIAQGAVQAVDTAFNQFANTTKPELGGHLNMAYLSQGAATERQRAIQAISKSRINGRSMFGQEAQMMH